jgi:hypothetical protein
MPSRVRLRSGVQRAVPLLLLFLLIVTGRAVFVSLFGESLPYWDQWDAEGAFLIKPWLEDTWGVGQLFAPHNEHRVVFTRLLALGLFEANQGQWDNMVAAYANTVVYAVVAGTIYAVLQPQLPSRLTRSVLFVALLLLAWLPYAQDNTLIGFQNQFFAMTGFAVVAVAIAAMAKDDAILIPALVSVAILGLFTMASGLLGAVAAAAVLMLRWWVGRLRPALMLIAVVLLATVAIFGYALVPHIAGHDVLKAPDFGTWLKATSMCMAGPLPHGDRIAWLIWLPTGIAAYRLLKRREAQPGDLAAFGMAGWVLLQCAAMGYSRGNDMSVVSSRYLDVLSVGLVVNLWFVMRFCLPGSGENAPRPAWRFAGYAVATVFLAVVAIGFVRRTPHDMREAAWKRDIRAIQTENVRRYVLESDPRHLDQPFMHIPYPHASRLAGLLDDPSIRSTLPASVRMPLPMQQPGSDGVFRPHRGAYGTSFSSCAPEHCLRQQGRWLSAPLSTPFPFIEVPVVANGSPNGLTVAVTRDDSQQPAASLRPSLTRSQPQRRFLRAPDVRFQLLVADQTDAGSLAFHAPIETGSLSMQAARLQDVVRLGFGQETSDSRRRFQLIESPIADQRNDALPLSNGQMATVYWQSPRAGMLARVSVFIGNYHGSSDGDLVMEVCPPRNCIRLQRPLKGTRDNSHVEFMLKEPVLLNRGESLSFRISTVNSTQKVALWTYASTQGSARMHLSVDPADAERFKQRTLRLGLTYVD